MVTKEYGFGICMVWSEKERKEGIINTYDGKNSPGKPEQPKKGKKQKGKSLIIKQYWEKIVDDDQ